MGVLDSLDGLEQDDAPEPPSTEGSVDDNGSTDLSPFSQSYSLEKYDLDDQTVDRMLSLLVAATNLL